MNKFNVKQYLFYATNSAANFNIGGRTAAPVAKITGSGGNMPGAAGGPAADANKDSNGGRTASVRSNGAGSYAISRAASRTAPSDASKRAVAGSAVFASPAGKPAAAQINSAAASQMPSAVPEKAAAGEKSCESGKTAYNEEKLNSNHFFKGENLLNGIMLAEILGKPKYLRKGRW